MYYDPPAYRSPADARPWQGTYVVPERCPRRGRRRVDGVTILALYLLVAATAASWCVSQVRGRDPHPSAPVASAVAPPAAAAPQALNPPAVGTSGA